MDPFVLLVIAAIVAVFGIGIGVAARRGGGDDPGDRGPYSAASQTRGDFAALGTTPDATHADEPAADPDGSGDAD